MNEPALRGLDGSPYLIADGPDADEQIQDLIEAERTARARLRAVRAELIKTGLLREVSNYQRSREVYESNAIEGLGPSMQRTHQILTDPMSERLVSKFDHQLLIKSIVADEDMKTVLGIEGARVLAQHLAGDLNSRPITESDLRSLHEMIAAGESYAGRYKHFHIKISRAAHEPLLPIDTPAAMHDLVAWLAGENELPATIRAACAHAWLTHIHPFEDGNGRLARILANLILTRSELPPSIVKNQSERGNYLDCLAHSDVAGDILPLSTLFLKTVNRYVKQIERPSFIRRMFDAEIRGRSQGLYRRWHIQMSELSNQLVVELRLAGIEAAKAGELGPEEFAFIRRLDSTGNTWHLLLRNAAGAELLLWFGYPSFEMRRWVEQGEHFPSLYFSVRNNNLRFRPYRKATPAEVGDVSEVMLVVDMEPRIFALVDGRPRVMNTVEAARFISDRIADAYLSGRIPLQLPDERSVHRPAESSELP
ncbi:Fic family protein [Micromonospora sp. KC721]|uniref:Fic family protein n=1 Tax=Micromonospora sp. KC721 TaxID=2530380 RepID=UPI001404EF08|nr:Fic family protein [Micromonospora sp. KC721]